MEKRENQKLILKVLTESRNNGLPYLTREQIVNEIKTIKPESDNLDRKVSQALYLLKIKHHRKWNAPKVVKVHYVDEESNKTIRGWTVKYVPL